MMFTTMTGAGVSIDLFDGPPYPFEFTSQRMIEAYTGVELLPVVALQGERALVTIWPDAKRSMRIAFGVSKMALPGGWLELLEDAA